MNKKVAIIGYGWVGKSMHELFPDALIFSPNRNLKGEALKDTDVPWDMQVKELQAEVNKCDFAFICVPTPCPKEGKLDIDQVAYSVSWLETPIIVIRSTINPGDSQMLEAAFGKRLLVQPEYLGETPQHPLLDTAKAPFIIIGGHWPERQRLIELYQTVYNANINIRQVNGYAAEIIKMTENRAIAYKVAQCQELYDVCEKANIDYYTIRDAVYGDDPRFNLWWTFVYPDKRGFNSKCIPKDVYAWCAWAESIGYEPKLTRALLEKNKEWINPPAPKKAKKKPAKKQVN